MTLLEEDIYALLPTSQATTSVERRTRLIQGLELFVEARGGSADTYQLTEHEAELAQALIAALVYEFARDNIIRWVAENEPSYTSMVEYGRRIEIDNIGIDIEKQTAHDFPFFAGLGVSLMKADHAPLLQPFIEQALRLLFIGATDELFKLAQIDALLPKPISEEVPYSQITAKTLRNRLIKALVRVFPGIRASIEQSLNERYSPNKYRLLRYVTSSTELVETIQGTASSSNPANAAIDGQSLDEHYHTLGRQAQKDNRVVDEIRDKLEQASPPHKLRMINALIVAGRRNPYALEIYLDAFAQPEKYRHGITDEYFLIESKLSPLSKESLRYLVGVLEDARKKPGDRLLVSKARQAWRYLEKVEKLAPGVSDELMDLAGSNSYIERSISIALISKKRSWISERQSAFVDRALEIVKDPISDLIVVEDVFFPYMMRATIGKVLIESVVALALDSGYQQTELLSQIMEAIESSNRDIGVRIDMGWSHAEQMSHLFGEAADIASSYLSSHSPSMLQPEGLPVLVWTLYEDIFLRKVVMLDKVYSHYDALQPMTPELQEVLNDLVENHREVLELIAKSRPIVDEDYVASVSNLFDKLNFRLREPRHLEPITTTRQQIDYSAFAELRTIDSPPLVLKLLEQSDLPMEILRKVLDTTTDRRTDDKIRAHIISCLGQLASDEHLDEVVDTLANLLEDRSPIVVASALYVMLHLLEHMDSPGRQIVLRKVIKECSDLTPRNSTRAYPLFINGENQWQSIRVDEVAHSICYKFATDTIALSQ